MAQDEELSRFPAEHLRHFSAAVFMHFGVSKADAEQAADVLARSDLRGIDSHGVARLHTYFDMLELGRINPNPNIKSVREKTSVATVDGDNGLGLVVGPKANEIAMDKAERYGSGWVSVCNTNHFGIAGYYPLKALERDLIGWAMTNSTKLVAPLWGAERMLGTNPIAIAFPGYKEPPIAIDHVLGIDCLPTVFVDDPTFGHRLIFSQGDFNFSIGHRAGGHIDDDGRLFIAGKGNRDGVCSEHSLRAPKRGDELGGISHRPADEVPLERLQGIVTRKAEMIGVAHTDPTGAMPLGFVHGNAVGFGTHD